MARLVIQRQRSMWMDRFRSYEAVIDGVSCGKLANGETLELEIDPGSHRVHMSIDWCRSREVEVDGGGDTRLLCRPGANPFLALLYITMWPDDYIKLSKA